MSLTASQREARRTRVGASEVAALLDPPQHRFVTAASIYARLVDGVQTESNEAMRDGQLAERHVLEMAREKYRLKAYACVRAYVHPVLPVTASPDAYIGDGEGLVEIKTTSAVWADQPPDYVLWQVQCQLWLARRHYAHVVVWQGSRLRMFTVERDQGSVRAIREGVERFWEHHLRPLIPPPPRETSSRDFTLENIKCLTTSP